MNKSDRERFDALVERVIDALPPELASRLEQIAVIVDDVPSDDLVAGLIRDGVLEPGDDGLDLCGLHTGTPITQRSVDEGGGAGSWLGGDGVSASMPDAIHLFRDAIVGLALDDGSDEPPDADWPPGSPGERAVCEEIRVTLLHEVGHHFGLDEDDLADLGYD